MTIEEAYHVYHHDLLSHAERFSRSRDEADDLMGKLWLRAVQVWDRFDGANPWGYLYRILRNLAVDAARTRKRTKHLSFETPIEGGDQNLLLGDTLSLFEPGYDDVEEELQVAWWIARVRARQHLLSPHERMVVMALLERPPDEHIYTSRYLQQTGFSASTFRVHLHRARTRLRELFQGDQPCLSA